MQKEPQRLQISCLQRIQDLTLKAAIYGRKLEGGIGGRIDMGQYHQVGFVRLGRSEDKQEHSEDLPAKKWQRCCRDLGG
jgi:hypothetical protein